MTALSSRRRESLFPGFVGAVVLHAAVFFVIVWLSPTLPIPLGEAVPINLVATGPSQSAPSALAAPLAHPAESPEPTNSGNPRPPLSAARAQAPMPTPTPKRRLPIRQAEPPVPELPIQASPKSSPHSTQRRPSFSLAALAASLAKEEAAAKARSGRAARGAARARTATQTQTGAGADAISQSDIEGLSELLNRLWFKNCGAAVPVDVTVKLSVGDNGQVLQADAGGRQHSSDPATAASTLRAVAAVYQAAPYAAEFRGKDFSINFVASKACSGR
ncbi:MAG: hypothetical protein ACRED8_02115 [Caulobacteraceae bacterium]